MKLLVVLVLFLSSITINAQNWPSFRGPNASGVADGTNPPTIWDLEKSQNVLRKTNVPGLSHSSRRPRSDLHHRRLSTRTHDVRVSAGAAGDISLKPGE